MATTRFDPSAIQKNLTGVDYPAAKDDLIETARHNDAPEQVMEWLENITDREYQSSTDLMGEIRDMMEEAGEE